MPCCSLAQALLITSANVDEVVIKEWYGNVLLNNDFFNTPLVLALISPA